MMRIILTMMTMINSNDDNSSENNNHDTGGARFLASTRDTQPVEWLKAPHQDENDSDDQDHCIEAAVHVKQLFGSSIGISLSVDSHRQLAVIGIAPPIGEPIRSEISISDHNDHNAGHHINRHAGVLSSCVQVIVIIIRVKTCLENHILVGLRVGILFRLALGFPCLGIALTSRLGFFFQVSLNNN